MKKKVGVLVDSHSIPKYVLDTINYANKSDIYEVTTLIINDDKKSKFLNSTLDYVKKKGIKRLISAALFRFMCHLESLFSQSNSILLNADNIREVAQQDFNRVYVSPEISSNGLIYRYSKLDIDLISSEGLDLLIRAGSGILRGEILEACPEGVISFHHGDNSINRGGPPGFWEVYEEHPRTGFVIQRLTSELDGGDILYKGYITTCWYYNLNLFKLYEISTPFLHSTIERIFSESLGSRNFEKVPYSNRLYVTPSLSQIVYYCWKTSKRLAFKALRKASRRSYRWGVAFQFSEGWRDIVLWRSVRIPNPPGRFLADPFVIKRNGNHYCFVEDYSYETGKGRISVCVIGRDGVEGLDVAVEEDFHLSYPFIFTYGDELYMCPETHEKGDIRLYKSVEFPYKWVYLKTIVSDIRAVDTNIFEKDGRWWLFTNVDQGAVDDFASQLHIFHSDSPVSDNWIPHEHNPVVCDPLKARNGGLILDRENIYRGYQRQGFDMYGEAVGITLITRLTPTEYQEEPIFEVEPNFFEGIKGTHTINYQEGLLVLDYVEVAGKK